MNINEFKNRFKNGLLDGALEKLYGEDACYQQQRYINILNEFSRRFPSRTDVRIFSAPGRSEIGGNHTDHQRGCALGAAINLDAAAVVAFHDENIIRVYSEGYGLCEVALEDLTVHEDEKGRTAAIIRGVASGFAGLGVKAEGFDAYVSSNVTGGSGLSSSAAFETLIGTIINIKYNDGKAAAAELAKLGQFAENVYFGKASGLLDQLVCCEGGFVFIDFENTANPLVKRFDFDFERAGFCLCITDTHGSHSDLTDDYTAVPGEMKSVAAYFGRDVLRDVAEDDFYNEIPKLREICGDRAVMRAAHFFGENRRAVLEAKALESGDLPKFFELYRQSASSSESLLQNLYSTKKPREQAIPVALMISRLALGKNAAARVHGGGFAGTIQAIVPKEQTPDYVEAIDKVFGEGSCKILKIRPAGGVEIK
ncbi:MAG TPA: galactokinase [Ruminococcaceae bacterium]|nr:galactokinase [Oscillospiraceae bacterium]